MWEWLDFMPEQAATWAADVDWTNNLITNISVFCIVVITAVMLFFAIKWRRSKTSEEDTHYFTHDTVLETVWTAVPTIICFYVFWVGYVQYREMREPPTNALEINVVGKKWNWTYTHKTGKKAFNELVVPIGEPVKLVMRSEDVLHSMFIPVMRVKEDVVPNHYSYLWFEATKEGDFHIFCTEYCGKDHSKMLSRLKVVSREQYKDYILDRTKEELPPEKLGEKLYGNLCQSCHSLDGSKVIGPSFKGLFKSTERELADGSKVKIDDEYVRESILNPWAKVVKGYPAQGMTPFEGQLSGEQVDQIIAYLKTL